MFDTELSNYIKTIHVQDQINQYNKHNAISNNCYQSELRILTQWINSNSKKPFMVYGESGIGKVHLLANLQNTYQKQNQKVLFKYSNCKLGQFYKNFSHQIYNFLSSFRQSLSIDKVIEIQEERIRKFFYYWSAKVSESLEQQIKNNGVQKYDKVVLIIEGIEKICHKSLYEQLRLYLPKEFTAKFKVIIVVDKSKPTYLEALKYFSQLDCEKLEVTIQNFKVPAFIEEIEKRKLRYMISQDLKDTHYFLLKKISQKYNLTPGYVTTFINFLMPCEQTDFKVEEVLELDYIYENISYDAIEQIVNEQDLTTYMLKFFEGHFVKDHFWKILYLLYVSYKGITLSQIKNIVKCTAQQIKLFYCLFKGNILKLKDRRTLFLRSEAIRNEIKHLLDKSPIQLTNSLHMQIYEVVSKQHYCLQKLQTCLYSLYICKNYFKLKQEIVKIENLLLLYKSQSKFQLFKYWICLIRKGYDPVIDYNKSIQYFYMQYLPTPESQFDILLVLSCFFRQLSQFENYNTPVFRHHKICGSIKEFKELGIYDEAIKLNLIELRQKRQKHDDHFLLRSTPNQNISSKIIHLHKMKSERKLVKPSLVKTLLRKDQEVLNQYEKLNPNIPENTIVFRRHFEEIIESFKKKPEKQNFYFYEQNLDDNENNPPNKFEQIPTFQFIKTEQEFLKSEPKYYYYKRWLWTKFSLMTLSIWKDFNRSISQITNSVEKSLQEENTIFQNCIRLIISVKEHKKNIMAKFQITDQMISNKIKRTNSTRNSLTFSFNDFHKTSMTLKLLNKSAQRNQKHEGSSLSREYMVMSAKKKWGSTKKLTNLDMPSTTQIPYQRVSNIKIKNHYNSLVFQNERLKNRVKQLESLRDLKLQQISNKIEKIKAPATETSKLNTVSAKQREYFIKLIEKSRFTLVKSLCEENNPIAKQHLESYIEYSNNLKIFLSKEKANLNELKLCLRELLNLKRQYTQTVTDRKVKKMAAHKQIIDASNIQNNYDAESVYEIDNDIQFENPKVEKIAIERVQLIINNIRQRDKLKQKCLSIDNIIKEFKVDTVQETKLQVKVEEWQISEPIQANLQRNQELLSKIKDVIKLQEMK